jgi:hypothetical protein
MSTPTRSHADDYAAETRVFRYMSDCLLLPLLCRSAACHRRRQCRGQPRDCLARFTPLVPEEARDWMKAALEGLRQHRPFEEVCENYPDELAAFAEWRRAVNHAFGRQG